MIYQIFIIIIALNLIGKSDERDTDHCNGSTCGCYRGYCWSYCGLGWCYTTKGKHKDHKYVKCSYTKECEPDWRCAGLCSISFIRETFAYFGYKQN